jgi:hypothetical protein
MKVKSLHIYPLKSARAIDLETADLGSWGLEGDRRFMLVDERGKFITQRELQILAKVKARIDAGKLALFLGDLSLDVTFDPERRVDAEIWDKPISLSLASDGANAALSGWFARPVRLVHADERTNRLCNPEWAGEGVNTGLSDGYPVLVTTTGSLRGLNDMTLELGGEGAGMERFRPNIVIDHDEPFADDFWGTIEIGGIRLDLVKPCPRCIMTTQDQETGERIGPDPMPAMRRIRMSADRRVAGVLFGWNAVPRSIGKVAIGDAVTVISRRPEGWEFKVR